MFSCRLFKTENSFIRHRKLLIHLRDKVVSMMRACKQCKDSKTFCEMRKDFDKCVSCVHFDRKCDLIIFEIEWSHVQKKRTRLRDCMRNAADAVQKATAWVQKSTAWLVQLQSQQNLIESRWKKMMHCEFQNVKKLEENEHKQTKVAFQTVVYSLLLNINSEQLMLPQNFDAWFNNFFSETVAEFSDSSWDSFLILKCSQYVHNLFTWLINETDLWCLVDLVYSLLYIQRSDSLNQFLKILFEWMHSSLHVKTMPRASHKGTCTSRWYTGKRGFKAKERGLRRCEGYMYRGKGSAKPDRALGSLKSAPSSRRLSTLVTLQTSIDRYEISNVFA